MSRRFDESPQIPERTGSHPLTFVPAPFATRPEPPYPHRSDYADFDPAVRRASLNVSPVLLEPPRVNATFYASTPLERRAGSEPRTGWRRQNVDIDTRRTSIPPTLEVTSSTFRERLSYPDRTMDEITDWMPEPVVETRGYGSQPITDAERLAARPSDRVNDWADAWPEENDPRRTRWVGYDNSNYARYGGIEDPNETSAVPTEGILESIEVEGDPLVALRRTVRDSQATIRREIDRVIALESENQNLVRRNNVVEDDNETLRARNRHLEQSRQIARNARDSAEEDLARIEERQLRLDLDEEYLARIEERQLRLDLDGLVEEERRNQAQQEAFEQANRTARSLQQSEARLTLELDSALSRADQLFTERNRLVNTRQQLEMERDHFEAERDRERDRNRDLQAQNQLLANQLVAARALATPPHVPPPVTNAPINTQPLAAAPATGIMRGRGRGVARGRAGRRGRGAPTAITERRKQPARHCKVEKNYRG
ncbi:MAG: hypothetical protein Q9161_000516 [Pseudevernia consocians]